MPNNQIHSNMTTSTLKSHLFALVAIICLAAFTSCETDEDIGYSLAGPNGITWYGDFGATDFEGDPLYGEEYPLYSEVTFISGSDSRHGIGREVKFYQHNLKYYDTESFDWWIENGILYMDYRDYTLRIYDYYVGNRTFSGRMENGFEFYMYLDRRW